MKKILVLGGRGFLGQHLCEALNRAQFLVTVPSRKPQARSVQTLPFVSVVQADIHDQNTLEDLIAKHDVVINLAAILHGSALEFEALHVQLPQVLATLCAKHRVSQVLHVSALGVKSGVAAPSLYLRSKARGEQALIRTLDQTSTQLSIFRPSVIFGADDRFINVFVKLLALTPVMPLGCAASQFQPVWVQDVVSAMMNTLLPPEVGEEGSASNPLARKRSIGPKTHQIFELGGPDVLSLKALVQVAAAHAGYKRVVLELPQWVAWLQALLLELMPGEPVMSRDNVASMKVPNVCSGEFPGLLACGVSSPKRIQSVFPPAKP